MRLLSQSESYTIGTDVILLFCGMPHFRKMGDFMEIERPFYLNRLLRLKDNGRIKIITGMRRAGKSYLLFT